MININFNIKNIRFNINKLFVNALLANILTVNFLGADIILAPRKEKIKDVVLQLKNAEKNIKLAKVTAACFVVGGIGSLFWDFCKSDKNNQDLALKEFITSLSQEQKQQLLDSILKSELLKPRQDESKDSDANNSSKTSFISKLKTYFTLNSLKSTTGYFYGKMKYFLPVIIKALIWDRTYAFFNRYLINTIELSDRIFASRTLEWFIEYHTSLIKSVNNTIKLLDKIAKNNIIDKIELESNFNILFVQLEKILGFMYYDYSLLSKGLCDERNRAEFLIKKSSILLKEFSNLFSDLLNLKDLSNIEKTVLSIKDKLIEIINNFESFKIVDIALDLYDTQDRNIFNSIDDIINPKKKNDQFSQESILEILNNFNNLKLEDF